MLHNFAPEVSNLCSANFIPSVRPCEYARVYPHHVNICAVVIRVTERRTVEEANCKTLSVKNGQFSASEPRLPLERLGAHT